MWIDHLPVRIRLSFAHALVMALIFAGVGCGLYKIVEYNLYRSIDASLMNSARMIKENHPSRGFSPLRMEGFLLEFFGGNYVKPITELIDLSKRSSEKFHPNSQNHSYHFPISLETKNRAKKGETTIETVEIKGVKIRLVSVPIIKLRRFTGELIQVATPLESATFMLDELAWVLWISLPAGFGLSFLIGYLFTARAFKPVREMTVTASSLSFDDMSKRIKVPVAKDELSQLAEVFNDLLARLEDSFTRLQRFNGDVAHELRTPLAVVKGEAELALRRERSPDDYKAALRTIVQESRHMTDIVQDLLLLARAESRSVAMSWERLNIEAFTRSLEDETKVLFSEKAIKLNLDITTAPSFIDAHPTYLNLAIKNILINAAKHSPSGAGVDFVVEASGERVSFTVKDHGEGIAKEHLSYIFDPFFRADTARNRAAGGAGIGLSLAKALIKLHSGKIDVQSELGKGTTFTISVPKAKPTESLKFQSRIEQNVADKNLALLPS